MPKRHAASIRQTGFSLIELMIAMTLTIFVMGLASTLIARSFKLRARENHRSDALADAHRALNIVSREIASAGFRMTTNGIVWQDSGDSSVRILANLNKYQGGIDNDVVDENEDVKFFHAAGTNYLVRYDKNDPAAETRTTVLANRIHSFKLYYFDRKVEYTTGDCATPLTVTTAGATALTNAGIANAKYVALAICVELPPEGKPGSAGYQPPWRTILVSDVMLRNANLDEY
jgi:type II secretory pathway component PulJ